MARMIQMVGPLSSEEIEDVVSSVRRLVSNEQRPRALSRDLNADRLLLTPSLRVVSEASPLSPLILATPLAEQMLVAEPVTVAPAAEPEPAPVAEVVEAAPDAEAPMVVEAEWEEEIWTTPQPTLAEVALGAEEAEVLVAAGGAAESDELIGAFADEPEVTPAPWAQVETEWEDDDPITFVPLRRRAENLSAKIAAAQSDVAPPVTETDEDKDPVAEAADPAPVDEAPLDAWSAPDDVLGVDPFDQDQEPEAASDDQDLNGMATELLDADGTPIAVLDEAALQDIVRQMIREELQGVLGERITRNVRKLVRAEINRALVARDLD